jgi:hypothetical protein
LWGRRSLRRWRYSPRAAASRSCLYAGADDETS